MTSRRSLITGALTGAAATVAAPSLVSTASAAALPKFAKTADVVIVGFGGAGAATAISAADNGASVLIIERQPEKTLRSNTRMSGGIFHSPDKDGDRAALKAYAKAMFSGENIPGKLEGEQPEVSDGLAEVWAELSPTNLDFMKSLDPAVNALGFRVPEVPGRQGMQVPGLSHVLS